MKASGFPPSARFRSPCTSCLSSDYDTTGRRTRHLAPPTARQGQNNLGYIRIIRYSLTGRRKGRCRGEIPMCDTNIRQSSGFFGFQRFQVFRYGFKPGQCMTHFDPIQHVLQLQHIRLIGRWWKLRKSLKVPRIFWTSRPAAFRKSKSMFLPRV